VGTPRDGDEFGGRGIDKQFDFLLRIRNAVHHIVCALCMVPSD
jgi:hypothetical protein